MRKLITSAVTTLAAIAIFAAGTLAGQAATPTPAVAEPAVIVQHEADPDAEIAAYNRGMEAGKEIGCDVQE